MKKSIFDYSDYKAYLKAYLELRPSRGHGLRSEIAKALGCQPAYVSQVLNSSAHFSPEQVESLNQWLDHTPEESEFLLLLLMFARAGTSLLKKRYQSQIDRVHESRRQLKNRVQIRQQLTLEDQQRYYSSWHYAAIHILVTIPKFQTLEPLCEILRLERQHALKVLNDLEKMDLLIKRGGEWIPSQNLIYLGNDSTLINKHHTNWRMRSIDSLDRNQPDDLHFSAVVSVSEKDVEWMRAELATIIEKLVAQAKVSTEETLRTLCIDLFRP
ncbi:MAG: TIGR02147 family protein [Bdellovibrionales bacterium]